MMGAAGSADDYHQACLQRGRDAEQPRSRHSCANLLTAPVNSFSFSSQSIELSLGYLRPSAEQLLRPPACPSPCILRPLALYQFEASARLRARRRGLSKMRRAFIRGWAASPQMAPMPLVKILCLMTSHRSLNPSLCTGFIDAHADLPCFD